MNAGLGNYLNFDSVLEQVAYTYHGDQLRTAQQTAPAPGPVQRFFHEPAAASTA